RNQVAPSVWIEEILVDRQPGEIKHETVSALPARSRGVNSQVTRSIELPPGRKQLDLVFTGISFTSPDRVEFHYPLEPSDADWIDGGTRRRVTYPFLPPGHYTFRVKACNNDGLWNEAGDAVNIDVRPFLWQTWWFKVGISIAGLAAVGGGVYLAARRRHRQKLERIARERELERERARIAQDIHDD